MNKFMILVGVLAGCTLIAFGAANHKVTRSNATAVIVRPSPPQGAGQRIPVPGQSDYVARPLLQPGLREALNVVGDRFEMPGKERLILVGVVSRQEGAQQTNTPCRLILEFPRRMRLEEQGGGPSQVTVFNGQDGFLNNGQLNSRSADLIETLVYDSVGEFFSRQSQGAATRFLGSRFRLDDGSGGQEAGPVYDLYQTTAQVKIGPSAREDNKLYYLNSDTLLVERVRYTRATGNQQTDVEIQLADWQRIQNQLVPMRLTRLEDGRAVLTFRFTSAALTARADDGSFDYP